VWGTPVVDRKRGSVYVATGNNYSQPAGTTSLPAGDHVESVMSLDAATGAIKWANRVTADACEKARHILGMGSPKDAMSLGRGALSRADWGAARSHFEGALARDAEHADAIDGLSEAPWWPGNGRGRALESVPPCAEHGGLLVSAAAGTRT
jgi:hypothetical protein